MLFNWHRSHFALSAFLARQPHVRLFLGPIFPPFGLYNFPPRLFLTRHSHFTEFGFRFPPASLSISLTRGLFALFARISLAGIFRFSSKRNFAYIMGSRIFFFSIFFRLRHTCEFCERYRCGCLLAFKVHRKLISFRFHKKSQWNFHFTLPFAFPCAYSLSLSAAIVVVSVGAYNTFPITMLHGGQSCCCCYCRLSHGASSAELKIKLSAWPTPLPLPQSTQQPAAITLTAAAATHRPLSTNHHPPPTLGSARFSCVCVGCCLCLPPSRRISVAKSTCLSLPSSKAGAAVGDGRWAGQWAVLRVLDAEKLVTEATDG